MKKLIFISSLLFIFGGLTFVNAFILPGLRLPTDKVINYDKVTEVKDGSIITKQVCYKKDKTELVISQTTVVVATEVTKIDAQIASLNVKKTDLLNSIKP